MPYIAGMKTSIQLSFFLHRHGLTELGAKVLMFLAESETSFVVAGTPQILKTPWDTSSYILITCFKRLLDYMQCKLWPYNKCVVVWHVCSPSMCVCGWWWLVPLSCSLLSRVTTHTSSLIEDCVARGATAAFRWVRHWTPDLMERINQ